MYLHLLGELNSGGGLSVYHDYLCSLCVERRWRRRGSVKTQKVWPRDAKVDDLPVQMTIELLRRLHARLVDVLTCAQVD